MVLMEPPKSNTYYGDKCRCWPRKEGGRQTEPPLIRLLGKAARVLNDVQDTDQPIVDGIDCSSHGRDLPAGLDSM
jgi:hypothetical protein